MDPGQFGRFEVIPPKPFDKALNCGIKIEYQTAREHLVSCSTARGEAIRIGAAPDRASATSGG
jgi:hypothetical protein